MLYHRSTVKVRPIRLARVNALNLHTVIRVFGIYTHAQLDRRLWDLVGYQLSRTGKEYQRRCVSYVRNVALPKLPWNDRCTFRASPRHKGDKVIPPASFPATPPDIKTIPDELPVVSDKLLEEVRRNPKPDGSLLISAFKLHEILVLAYCLRMKPCVTR